MIGDPSPSPPIESKRYAFLFIELVIGRGYYLKFTGFEQS